MAALTVMAAAVAAALGMVVTLRADLGYSLSRGQALNLGDVRSISPSTLRSNTYARVAGIPTLARAVRFRRGTGSRYRVFPLAGQDDLYVQVEEGSAESFARSEFTGRLVTFEDLGGRYAELALTMRRDLQLPVTDQSFLLLADEPPRSYAWTWIVGVLCVAFVMLDLYFILRWFRPVRWVPATDSTD